MIQRTIEEHIELGRKLYGDDMMAWRFRCPICGHVASSADYRDAGAPEGAVGYSCIGRWSGAKRKAFGDKGKVGPCDYAGGGLFNLSPIRINGEGYFAFADETGGAA